VILLVSGTSSAVGPSGGSLRTLVEETSRELKRVRKKTLKGTPRVESISRERYVDEYVVKTLDFIWGGDYERSLAVFKVLGMLPTELEAKSFVRRYGAVMTVAAYDFFEKRILFPQTKVSREVLLHELVHAMQDEQHDIKKLMTATGFEFDKTLALGALLEGEAVNVQLRYRLGRSRVFAGITPYGTVRKESRAHFEEIRQRWMRWMPDIPPNLIRAQAFVYDEGVLFVERLRRRKRNWGCVDAAYRMPPRSTSQILHPEKYLGGEWPIELGVVNKETLIDGYKLVTENTLGEFGMRLFLETHLPKLEAPHKAVEGWRGDRVYLYRDERKRPVLLWVSTWQTPKKAERMKGLLSKALTTHAGESFKGSVRVKRRDLDVVAVLGVPEPFQHLLDAEITRKTTQGRPFGDEEEKAKGR